MSNQSMRKINFFYNFIIIGGKVLVFNKFRGQNVGFWMWESEVYIKHTDLQWSKQKISILKYLTNVLK